MFSAYFDFCRAENAGNGGRGGGRHERNAGENERRESGGNVKHVDEFQAPRRIVTATEMQRVGKNRKKHWGSRAVHIHYSYMPQSKRKGLKKTER